MKNLIITILVAFVAMAPFKETSATNDSPSVPNYSIPAYNVPVTQNTIFQEFKNSDKIDQSRARRTAHCDVETQNPPSGPNPIIAVVEFYSLDGQDVYGPYNVRANNTLHVNIDNREWGVNVLQIMESSFMSVWIEE